MTDRPQDQQESPPDEETLGFRIRTDNLRKLRPLVDWAADQTGTVERLPRIYLIIDANTVRRELGFRLRRKKAEARTDLDDILASGIATVFAPPALVGEVEKHLERWASQMKTPLDQLVQEWTLYKEGIVFCKEAPVRTEPARRIEARDPKDLPYVYLQANLSAEAILTLDKDIRDTGSPTADVAVLVDLRDYARNQSVFVTIATGSVLGISVVAKALMEFGRLLLRSVIGLLLTLAAGALLWFVHSWEKSRHGASTFRRAWNAFAEFVRKMLRMMERSHSRAKIQWKRVLRAFSKARRTLRQFVFAVCVMARKALTTAEISRRVLAEGHRTRAKRFRAQVRRCLRTDPRFADTPEGWRLHGWVAAA